MQDPVTPFFDPNIHFRWFILIGRSFLSMTSLSLSEIMFMKFMYIHKWSQMAMKDDNMISLILWRTNILLTSIITMQCNILEDIECNPIYKTITGTNDCQSPSYISDNSVKM